MSISAIENAPLDWWLRHAIATIKADTGDVVSVDEKRKVLFKFGENTAAGNTESTIMELQGSEVAETLETTNSIDAIVSDDSNTATITIEGHTVSGTGTDQEFTFVVQQVNLTGTTPASLTTPLARCSRIYNGSSTALTADSTVYVYASDGVTVTAGVPQTDSAIKIVIVEASKNNTSLKAATTFSKDDYYVITQVYFGISKKTGASADFKIKTRLPGRLFRTRFETSLDTASTKYVVIDLKPYVIVNKNSDVILTSNASTTNVSVYGGFNGVLAKIVG